MIPRYSVASTVSASGGNAKPHVKPPSVMVSAISEVANTMPVSGSVYVPEVACAKTPGIANAECQQSSKEDVMPRTRDIRT